MQVCWYRKTPYQIIKMIWFIRAILSLNFNKMEIITHRLWDFWIILYRCQGKYLNRIIVMMIKNKIIYRSWHLRKVLTKICKKYLQKYTHKIRRYKCLNLILKFLKNISNKKQNLKNLFKKINSLTSNKIITKNHQYNWTNINKK